MKKIPTLNDCQKLAAAKEGICLSTVYVDSKSPMEWSCKNKHMWKASYNRIRAGTWCLQCVLEAKRQKHENMCHKTAAAKGGRFLSTTYKDAHTEYDWQCEHGHTWSALYSNVLLGHWCPTCYRERRLLGIGCCNSVAKQRGGKCLSNKYIGNYEKMWWECGDCGNKWEAAFDRIKNAKSWCPICAQKRTTKNSNKISIKYHWKTDEELYCKASYESKVVDYLNANKIDYDWQPEPYTCKTLLKKNGKPKLFYIDLYLPDEDKYVEIKGYFRGDALEKWNEFKETYPTAELWDKQKLKDMKIL